MSLRALLRVPAAAIVFGALGAAAADADACGLFASPTRAGSDLARPLPYLSVERVLVVWDKTTGTEDLVREVRFDQADRAFGFVVPVPSQPAVFAVDVSPFDRLAELFPFETTKHSLGSIASLGPLGGGVRNPATARVVSKQRIGRFTAFVLQADDAGGLRRWLPDNGFDAPAAAESWIDHYVALGFSYVALRYDAPASMGGKRMTSETVRIRFTTPIPYFPYSEPTLPRADKASRLLEVWFASQEPALPVASWTFGESSWARPWDGSVASPPLWLGSMVASMASVVPAAELYVSVFRDRKVSREGWGDALIVPYPVEPPFQRRPRDAAIAADWPLLSVLDARLEAHAHDRPPGSSVLFPPPDPDPVAVGVSFAGALPDPGGCQMTGRGSVKGGAWAMLLAVAATRCVRRRGQRR